MQLRTYYICTRIGTHYLFVVKCEDRVGWGCMVGYINFANEGNDMNLPCVRFAACCSVRCRCDVCVLQRLPQQFVFEDASIEVSIYFHGNFHLIPWK